MNVTDNVSFNKCLATIKTSSARLNENVQQAWMFAINKVTEDGNTTPITRLRETVRDTKGLNVNRLNGYTDAHTNLVWSKYKNAKGNEVEGYRVRKGETPTVTTPTYSWFDFEPAKVDPKAVDADLVIRNAMKKIAGALDKDNIKGTKTHARKVLKAVEEAMEKLAS